MHARPSFIGLLRGNWFLLGLLAVVSIGSYSHAELSPLAELSWLQTALVFSVMWMMAAPVPFELVTRTLSRPLPGLLATAINMGLIPLLTLCLTPLLTPDLAGGLLVASTVPSTLASAAVWTRRAGGDDTVAIFVTLLTNLGCVVITPLWLMLLLGVRIELELSDLVQSLVILVVVPIALAQTMRLSQPFCELAERSKRNWAVLCQCGILLMVLLGSIQMGNRLAADQGNASSLTLSQLVGVTVAAIAVHVVALVIAWHAAQWLGIARPQRIAVSLSGSQKTLMVGLKLAIDCGVSILPMVVFHISQLLIDTVIVQWWSRGGGTVERPTAPEPQASSGSLSRTLAGPSSHSPADGFPADGFPEGTSDNSTDASSERTTDGGTRP
jgi:solute carrier family 10 (sodium/bile acid cotransporter), member 7